MSFRFILLYSFLFINFLQAQEINTFNYLVDRTCDTFFSKVICDPYRWLEDVKSDKTTNWIKYQNEKWDKLKGDMYKSLNSAQYYIDKYSLSKTYLPLKKGEYYFRIYYTHELATPSLFMGKREDYDADSFDDFPVFSQGIISQTDRIELRSFEVSKNSKYLAVCFSRNGSERNEIIVIDTDKRVLMKDHVFGVMYSDIVWYKDGFLYTKYKAENTFATVKYPEVFYHKIGTEPKEDLLIFTRGDKYNRYFDYLIATDDSTIILKEEDEANNFYNLFSISVINNKPVVNILMNKTPLSQNIEVFDYRNEEIIAQTNYLSPNGSLISINVNDITNWKQLGNDYKDAILVQAELMNDSVLFAQYRTYTQIDLFVKMNTKGEVLAHTNLMQGLTVQKTIKLDKRNIVVQVGFPVIQNMVYTVNIDTFKLKPYYEKSISTFDYTDLSFKIENYDFDGSKTPILIIHKKNLKLNGSNPTLLEGYGGFGNLTKFSFQEGVAHFVNQGGVYAYAYVRGNGDLGEDFEMAGKRLNKTKCIEDFNAAAEFLINKKFTSPNKLAITGAGHGGLLVAAAMIKRPELFKVVVAEMGVYDMLRFEKFTVGGFQINEFGTVSEKKDFENLFSYSPYHNIKDDINYPTTLVVCSENDDRTPPFQSYKFTGRLQQNPSQRNDVFLKVIKKAGHYGANRYFDSLDDLGDKYGFIMHYLNQP